MRGSAYQGVRIRMARKTPSASVPRVFSRVLRKKLVKSDHLGAATLMSDRRLREVAVCKFRSRRILNLCVFRDIHHCTRIAIQCLP